MSMECLGPSGPLLTLAPIKTILRFLKRKSKSLSASGTHKTKRPLDLLSYVRMRLVSMLIPASAKILFSHGMLYSGYRCFGPLRLLS
jgi:hypothetical protein